MKDWKSIPDHARVWVYQSNRVLSESEISLIQGKAADFINQWSSHGSRMEASFALLHERFLIILADEQKAQASGCSIDSSIHFVQSLEEEMKLDFFDRMKVVYKTLQGLTYASLQEVPGLVTAGTLCPESIVFDMLISSKKELDSSFEKKMSETWMSRYL